MNVLTPITHDSFDGVYAIMLEAFPRDERRSYEKQKALLDRESYRIYALTDSEGEAQAFAAVYDLEDELFVEHLAVRRDCRSGGIGSGILSQLKQLSEKRLCLEVELPETDIAKRRIGFYERNGFTLNTFDYIQPSLGEGRQPIPLRIMTTDGKLSEPQQEKIKAEIYREVYGEK